MVNNMMVILLGLVLCSTELLSQDSKNDLFAQLRKRYGNMNSLEVKFIGVEPISGMKG
ncbi:MAG: hypothetical protein RIT37_1780, partial [Bacteroidota bacterium]